MCSRKGETVSLADAIQLRIVLKQGECEFVREIGMGNQRKGTMGAMSAVFLSNTLDLEKSLWRGKTRRRNITKCFLVSRYVR